MSFLEFIRIKDFVRSLNKLSPVKKGQRNSGFLFLRMFLGLFLPLMCQERTVDGAGNRVSVRSDRGEKPDSVGSPGRRGHEKET